MPKTENKKMLIFLLQRITSTSKPISEMLRSKLFNFVVSVYSVREKVRIQKWHVWGGGGGGKIIISDRNNYFPK